MARAVLRATQLDKTYVSGGVEFRAIRNLDLEIYAGQFTVIMGSSGSGKSTLLYLLSGLDRPTRGEVHLESTRLDNLSERALAIFRRTHIGFVFQAINLVPNLTILENLLVPGYLQNKDRHQVERRAQELLYTMHISEQADRLPSQVSGGQQQRAAIARALINSPHILFADEPTGSLNSSQGENVLNLLSEISEQGQTIAMVTHDLKAACRADRILFIKDGQIGGDLALEKYAVSTAAEREQQIFSWLKEKGW